MIIPHDQLARDTLLNLIEEFVTRDGTDYGEAEVGLSDRVAQVEARLNSGEVAILFSQNTGLCNIVYRNTL
ncbi:YheU family protein [Aliamphritea hakodatensis]|uniref:YheU family protein n=1 Tax=Aliamphritea hakodatensis TaxID=2895352 RepID=UPI0022FD9782|nr:YheU family protein [Aliamphritea hakodatensis]